MFLFLVSDDSLNSDSSTTSKNSSKRLKLASGYKDLGKLYIFLTF